MDIPGLTPAHAISSHLVSVKRSPYLFCTVKASKVEALKLEGWETVPTKLKKSVRMRKPKADCIAFEDRVWALFAQMRFDYLNKDSQFKLEYAPSLSKQVDVFAADEEAALIVECKSSSNGKKPAYQQDINEMGFLKEGLRSAVHKIFKEKPKVAFIFATNTPVSEPDKVRLEGCGIFHFNEADLTYWELLVGRLGPAARYQLFGKLFAGQPIPMLENRVPAVKGKMSSGHDFYSFATDPNLLLRMAFILHRTATNVESSEAYQRLINKSRLSQIGKFIDKGGYFPNSVIVNIEAKTQDIKWEIAGAIDHDAKTSMGILHLPKIYRSIFIIDGQHRLYGYSKAASESHHTIPIVAFINLPQKDQARIFVDINHNQKPVPVSILRSIMADFNWDSRDAAQALSALKTRLVSRLNFDDTSPLYQRIVMAEEKKSSTRCLTLETILNWGLPSKTGFFGKTKGTAIIKTGYLTSVSPEDTLNKSVAFFKECFSYIQNELRDQWDLGCASGGFIAMNNGVTSTMRTIDLILGFLCSKYNLAPEDMDGKELARQVVPYLAPVVKFVSGLNGEGLNKLRTYFGASAPDKIMMEFANAIHEEYQDFSPEGLGQWIIEHTGKYTELSWTLGSKYVEPLIHNYIIDTLKREFGERSWWNDGVPINVQKDCATARIENRSQEPDWHFLTTIQHRDIIDKNWALFGSAFSPPGSENASKEKKLAWFVRFNTIRQRYSHPQRDVITEDEYLFIRDLYEWLKAKLEPNKLPLKNN